ncbi:hypothetical protein BDZ45DRAFT_691635 [Acephala macrosclerotiorum]|nr:hypothetical protein BDZ45DRAFT_691635 [Acephala macrosclerotiorum]
MFPRLELAKRVLGETLRTRTKLFSRAKEACQWAACGYHVCQELGPKPLSVLHTAVIIAHRTSVADKRDDADENGKENGIPYGGAWSMFFFFSLDDNPNWIGQPRGEICLVRGSGHNLTWLTLLHLSRRDGGGWPLQPQAEAMGALSSGRSIFLLQPVFLMAGATRPSLDSGHLRAIVTDTTWEQAREIGASGRRGSRQHAFCAYRRVVVVSTAGA